MNDLNQPAIIRSDCSFKERKLILKSMIGKLDRDKAAIGAELIILKEQCVREQKGWFECLSEIGTNERSAERWMDRARNNGHADSNYRHKSDEHPDMSEIPDEADPSSVPHVDDSLHHEPEQVAPNHDSQNNAQSQQQARTVAAPASQPATLKLCRECRVRGAKHNCKDCKALNEPQKTASTPRPPQNGRIVFDDKIILDLIGKLARAIVDRSKAYGETKAFQEMRQKHELLIAAWDRWQLEKELR